MRMAVLMNAGPRADVLRRLWRFLLDEKPEPASSAARRAYGIAGNASLLRKARRINGRDTGMTADRYRFRATRRFTRPRGNPELRLWPTFVTFGLVPPFRRLGLSYMKIAAGT
jgi:hypothetical protein